MEAGSKFLPPTREIEFIVEKEAVSRVRFEDGTVWTARLVVMGADDCGFEPDGVTPRFMIRQQIVQDVKWPEHIAAAIAAKRGGGL